MDGLTLKGDSENGVLNKPNKSTKLEYYKRFSKEFKLLRSEKSRELKYKG